MPTILASRGPQVIQLFGLSFDYPNERISLFIQVLGISVCFLIGLLVRRLSTGNLHVIAIIVGIAADIVGQFLFAGGGPGACAGLVVLPLFCMLAASAGRKIANTLRARPCVPPPNGHPVES